MSGGTIQLALDALKQKKSSVDQVTILDSPIIRESRWKCCGMMALVQVLERVLACLAHPLTQHSVPRD